MKKALFLLLVVCNACSTSQKTGGDSSKGTPVCIKQLIKKFEIAKKQNPPRSIYSYRYNDQTVYYVPAICCDQYSDLYDSDCNLIGHPDGGFTGRGDGWIPDFNEAKTEKKLIWKDSR
ncbi:MAG: hypothetical protein ABI707_17260 [Ferruginibacter sp.]